MSSSVLSFPSPVSHPARPIDRERRHAWRTAALLRAALDGVVPSAEPAVAFASLAAACVPALADECVIQLVEQAANADGPETSSTIRYPKESAGISTGPDTSQSDVTTSVDGGETGGQPPFRVTATFGWHDGPRVEDADQVIADLLVRTVAEMVQREWLTAELERARDKVVNLGDALGTSRQIGQALGILMATYKLTAQQAFDLLRGVSQHTHRKLRDIAEDVCHTGTLDLADHGHSPVVCTQTHPPAAHLRSVAGAHA